jgi:transposase-like protein
VKNKGGPHSPTTTTIHTKPPTHPHLLYALNNYTQAPRYDDEEDEGANQSESAEQQQQQLEAELEAIDTVQGELTALEEAQAEEVLQVLRKYAQKKAPIYQQRQQAIDGVPEFWFRTLLAHPTIGEQISDLDQEVFRHLTSLEVVDVEGTQQDYRVNFHFAENEYFSDAVSNGVDIDIGRGKKSGVSADLCVCLCVCVCV